MSQELSVQKFIDAGYREYPVSVTSKALHKYADRSLQKRVKENSSTLYFIHVYYYVQTYDMDLASIRIYNRALTATEVRQNFNATRGRFGI